MSSINSKIALLNEVKNKARAHEQKHISQGGKPWISMTNTAILAATIFVGGVATIGTGGAAAPEFGEILAGEVSADIAAGEVSAELLAGDSVDTLVGTAFDDAAGVGQLDPSLANVEGFGDDVQFFDSTNSEVVGNTLNIDLLADDLDLEGELDGDHPDFFESRTMSRSQSNGAFESISKNPARFKDLTKSRQFNLKRLVNRIPRPKLRPSVTLSGARAAGGRAIGGAFGVQIAANSTQAILREQGFNV